MRKLRSVPDRRTLNVQFPRHLIPLHTHILTVKVPRKYCFTVSGSDTGVEALGKFGRLTGQGELLGHITFTMKSFRMQQDVLEDPLY